ncbi:MAG: hypothetical protein GXX85_04375 [Ignavibacteria bacterium]|nr:hypothetical protein [Ignavibacteria bacterium]
MNNKKLNIAKIKTTSSKAVAFDEVTNLPENIIILGIIIISLLVVVLLIG